MTRTELTKAIITCAYKNKEGHIPSALSVLDCILAIQRRYTLVNFILSKGHASLGLYAVMMDAGLISEQEFYSFGQFDSPLGGHPTFGKAPFIRVSSGSLGHGFPFAVGLALAHKILGKSAPIFCLIGDGEANEGTIWEAALIAYTQGLSNLICLMDFNRSGERAVRLESCIGKFISFGWDGMAVNGHDQNAIIAAIEKPSNAPKFIQLNTVKGKGCPSMENNPEWHHKTPNTEEEYLALLKEVYDA